MLWVDKHRPVSFDKLDYHKELSARLQQMVRRVRTERQRGRGAWRSVRIQTRPGVSRPATRSCRGPAPSEHPLSTFNHCGFWFGVVGGPQAETGDIPHMLFYGPSGAGKKTRILVLLRALFGSGVEKMRLEHRSFKTPSKRTVDITSVASSYHIEINPGDAGIYDRYVVQEVIKEIAMYSALHGGIESSLSGGAAAGGGGAGEGASGGKPPFKVLVLTEVDRLTRDAQAALRRTMEAYSANCRLILCCESPSKVIDPVRSRCLGVRIAAPMESEARGVLEGIVRREGLTVPPSTLVKICKLAKGNLRRAILMLEAMRVQAAAPVLGAAEPPAMDWELYIQSIADEMTERKETSTLISVRKKLYDLLSNCIPADVIFKVR